MSPMSLMALLVLAVLFGVMLSMLCAVPLDAPLMTTLKVAVVLLFALLSYLLVGEGFRHR